MAAQIAAFLGISLLLAWLSRAALRRPDSHGFYRFIAWEAILALLVLNLPWWFVDRFAPHQLLSWLLLFAALAVLAAGLVALRRGGRGDRTDPALFGFERTAMLVTSGIFRYIRHPLYASLLLLAWGIWLKHPTLVALLPAVVASVALAMTARRDEAECIDFFGQPYRDYMARTHRFVPWVY